MTPDPVTVTEDAEAEEIARLLERHRIRRVPVVRDGRLVGVVSRADLLRAAVTPPDAVGPGGGDAALRHAVLAAMREQPWADTYWTHLTVRDGAVGVYGYVRSDAVRRGFAC